MADDRDLVIAGDGDPALWEACGAGSGGGGGGGTRPRRQKLLRAPRPCLRRDWRESTAVWNGAEALMPAAGIPRPLPRCLTLPCWRSLLGVRRGACACCGVGGESSTMRVKSRPGLVKLVNGNATAPQSTTASRQKAPTIDRRALPSSRIASVCGEGNGASTFLWRGPLVACRRGERTRAAGGATTRWDATARVSSWV